MPIGLTLPFARNTGALGFLAYSKNQLEATRYNIKSLLLTDWGERPNHFKMGCNLTSYLFNPITADTQDIIAEQIRAQVSRWLPYVSIDAISVTIVEEQQIHIRLAFSITGRSDLNDSVEATITAQTGG